MRWLAALALLLACTGPARADGKLFGVEAKVAIPGQSALLVWRDGVETLVIESTFEGAGTEFAWIVPLPAVPRIEAATRGLFPTLRALTAPEVMRDGSSTVGALALLVSLLGLIVAGVVAARRGVSWQGRFTASLMVLFFLVSLGGVLVIPKGSFSAAKGGVTVHAEQVVGAYDTAVLSGSDAAAVRGWLDEHGFLVPEEATPVLDAYVREGWVFAAARLRREGGDDAQVTHPLAFTFEAATAVYPLRLTGTGQENLTLDLYVCADEGARAAGLEVEFRDRFTLDPDSREDVPFLHEGLKGFAHGTAGVTKLHGRLSREDLGRDLLVEWEPLDEMRPVYWTRSAARAFSLSSAHLFALALGVALLVAIDRRKQVRGADILKAVAAGLVAVVVMGVVVDRSLPVIEAGRSRAVDRLSGERSLLGLLAGSRSLEEARRRLRDLSPGEAGYLPAEIDAPHGFGLRETDSGPELIFYGPAGGERTVQRLADDE